MNILLLNNTALRQEFELSDLPVCTELLQIHQLGSRGAWYQAKIRWLSYTEHLASTRDNVLNLYGDEAEYSMRFLAPLMESFTTSRCEGGLCDGEEVVTREGLPLLV